MTLQDRFWAKVDKTGNCWEWMASKIPRGYGTIKIDGKVKRAHRVAWELCNGQIPEGLHCLHSCDNTSCCNPDHLFLGTHQDNMTDMANKGRSKNVPRRGEASNFSRINENVVRNIRRYYAAGAVTQQWLANVYGISRSNVGMIVTRKRWSHI